MTEDVNDLDEFYRNGTEFEQTLGRYIRKFGHTFTSFAICKPAETIALVQMNECLAGTRAEPVTDESIGFRGEGIYEDEELTPAERLEDYINASYFLIEKVYLAVFDKPYTTEEVAPYDRVRVGEKMIPLIEIATDNHYA